MYRYTAGLFLSIAIFGFCMYKLGQSTVEPTQIVCQVVDWRREEPIYTVQVECREYFRAWEELAYDDAK